MNHRRGGSSHSSAKTTTTHHNISLDTGSNHHEMSDAVAEFDALRREATKLERHLEDKVSRYQQLAQRLMTGDDGMKNGHSSPHHASNGSSSSLLESAENGTLHDNSSGSHKNNQHDNHHEEESSLSSDIHRTISAMSDLVNDRMSPAAERTGRSQHALLVKRYREILFDCSTDFRKTSANVARRRESRELFAKGDGTLASSGDHDHSDMEQLLRERQSIGNSLGQTRNIIGQAEEIRGDLRNQGQSLRGVSGTMASIAGAVPGLNHVIEGIRRKRSRDDMIVSGVIAACILFTLWYVFVA